MTYEEKRNREVKQAKGIAIFVVSCLLAIVGVITLLMCAHTVEPSYSGLKISGGELQQTTLQPRFYLLVPFWQNIEDVFVGIISTDEDKKGKFVEDNPFRGIQPLSKDGQVLDIDVQLAYAVSDAIKFREKTGSYEPRTIEQLVLVPTVRKIVYDYASEYTWKGLIQEGDRQEFGMRVTKTLQTGEVTQRTCQEEHRIVDETTGTETIVEAGCKVEKIDTISQPSDYGVTVNTVNFKKIKPNQKIIAAVEEAQAKEQEVKIAQQESKIATEQANRKIEEKRGETESQKLQSAAEGYKIRIMKEEEAKGVMALAEAEKARALALAASQQLIEFEKVEVEKIKAQALVEFAKKSKGSVPNEINIIGTDEARDMSLFFGMGGIVADAK